MAPPPVIIELVEHFARNANVYRNNLNETEVRVQFIDPFFEALGWDIHNKQRYAESYKDVLHEYALRTGPHTEAPDYCFQVGGTRKFYVEAKRPAVNIGADPAPAFQLRSYAWTSKLSLSLLTNFAELSVYDCRTEPRPNDKPSVARIDLIPFSKYPDQWDDIASRFSKDAVYKGSFDRYTVSTKLKKGTAEVDDAFLAEIESWRKELATNIATRNPSLSQRELNFAVQRTIDRVIFLRICEDRGIEKYGQLQALQHGDSVYRRLCTIYERADEKYNSGLFHFTHERDRAEAPDKLTPKLKIDDARLKAIFKRLYYPESSYQFSHFPADILGQVYEQFLGQVIRLTPSHQARVELKPELRKAEGVYYTPTYIVDYIVENTLGKLLTDKTPKEAAKLRILDPACGSGSFLLGAYQYMLNWHRDWYLGDGPEKYRKLLYQTQGGDWRLSTAEKKRILLTCLYGVDIDTQAVEVTKLSLLLKVLEGENEQTLGTNLRLFHERALPDLGANIKCGNSLIGSDFYQNQQLLVPDEEERLRTNVFDWKGPDGFSQIMKSGGFDAVIGNPPYRMLQPHDTPELVLSYLRQNFVKAEFKIDFFHLFLERGVKLLRNSGRLGFIIPSSFLNNVYTESLRESLAKQCCVESISVARGRVFANADVHTSVLVFRRESDPELRANHEILTTTDLSNEFVRGTRTFGRTRQGRFEAMPGRVWNVLLNEQNAPLIERVIKGKPTLGGVSEINRGLITGDRSRYFSPKKLSSKYVPILTGTDVNRYFINTPREFVLFERPESAGGCWDPEVHFAPHKVVVRQIGDRPTAALLTDPIAVTGNIFTVRSSAPETDAALLGILNSQLIRFIWQILFADFKQTFPQVTIFSLSQIPISGFDGKVLSAKAKEISGAVEQIVDLYKRAVSVRTDQEGIALKRRIDAAERHIDQQVYDLYELTPQEVSLVENTNKPPED